MTAEVGRQPWIIYNVMLVAQAANYSSSFLIPGILDHRFLSDFGSDHILFLRKGTAF